MDIESTYQKILKDVELGHRGLVRFSTTELEELGVQLQQTLTSQNDDQLEKLLFLIEHSAGLYGKYEPLLLQTLMLDLSDRLIVFALNCSRKHIIAARFQKGHRLSFEYLEVLKKHLHSKSPEVQEWTLRTIEECGNQGVYFLREFDKIKPPPWKWFNSHQRAVREIIALLERRWSQFEKSRPE